MKLRRYAAMALTAGLGIAGLAVVVPIAVASPPCGTYQANAQTNNTTGNNEGSSLANANNIAPSQGNNNSGASNVLCGGKIASGNKVILFGTYEEGPAPEGPRCDTLQNDTSNNNTSNTTGDNAMVGAVNADNVLPMQGNNNSGASNVMCDSRVASDNTFVLFGKVVSNDQHESNAAQCTHNQNTWSKNKTGNNLLDGLLFLPAIANANNIVPMQGGNNSGASNFLCSSDFASGNVFGIGSTYSSAPGGPSPTPGQQCTHEQKSMSVNGTGSNMVSSLLNINNLLNQQADNSHLLTNTGCDLEVLGNQVVLAGMLAGL